MNDYNDGNWWGWNGGECPIDVRSEIEIVPLNGMRMVWHANVVGWSVPSDIIAFRVTKEYIEPPKAREVWLFSHKSGSYDCFDDEHSCREKANVYGRGITVTKFREVME